MKLSQRVGFALCCLSLLRCAAPAVEPGEDTSPPTETAKPTIPDSVSARGNLVRIARVEGYGNALTGEISIRALPLEEPDAPDGVGVSKQAVGFCEATVVSDGNELTNPPGTFQFFTEGSFSPAPGEETSFDVTTCYNRLEPAQQNPDHMGRFSLQGVGCALQNVGNFTDDTYAHVYLDVDVFSGDVSNQPYGYPYTTATVDSPSGRNAPRSTEGLWDFGSFTPGQIKKTWLFFRSGAPASGYRWSGYLLAEVLETCGNLEDDDCDGVVDDDCGGQISGDDCYSNDDCESGTCVGATITSTLGVGGNPLESDIPGTCQDCGALDPGFPVVRSEPTPHWNWYDAVAVQPDGKILAGGMNQLTAPGNNAQWYLARYNTNGTLDSTFNSSGVVTEDFVSDNNQENIKCVLLQPDGKIVAGGRYGASAEFALTRYNANGSVDSSFGTSGLTRTDFGPGQDKLEDCQLLRDGRILAAGSSHDGTSWNVRLAMYTPNGALDTSWGTSGSVSFGESGNEEIRAMDVAGGFITVVGIYDTNDSYVARFDMTGAPVNAFGTNGALVLDTSAEVAGELARDVKVKADGSMIVVGIRPVPSSQDAYAVRLDATGAIDTSFGTAGYAPIAVSGVDGANSVLFHGDGRIVVGGHRGASARVVGLKADGTLDTTFGTGGELTVNGSWTGVARALAFDPNGGLAVAGDLGPVNPDLAVFRALCTPVPSAVNRTADLVLGQSNFTGSSAGTTLSTMNVPRDVAVDPTTGKVFVVEENNHRVLRFGSYTSLTNGAAAEAVLGQASVVGTSPGLAANRMSAPARLTVDYTGRLWVADTGNHRVLGFNNASTIATGANANVVIGAANKTTAGGGAASATSLFYPFGLAADPDGTLWIADYGHCRVLRFDGASSRTTDGASATAVLGQASATAQSCVAGAATTDAPSDVFVDHAGRLWIADALAHRVLRYNDAYAATGSAADGVLGQPDFTSSAPGLSAGEFNLPHGIAVTPRGVLYVADQQNNRVLAFDPDSALQSGGEASWVLGQSSLVSNTPASGATGMVIPSGITYGVGAGVLWVADTGNHRVLGFAACEGACGATCGDGIVQVNVGEQCDDGNAMTESCDYGEMSCTVCNSMCQEVSGAVFGYCGDNMTQVPNEDCDDGNAVTESCTYGEESCEVCTSSCFAGPGVVVGYCGDSTTQGGFGEGCDDGNATTELCVYGETSCTVCNSSCQSVAGALTGYCGDNTTQSSEGETCDDGNTTTETCVYGETSCTVCDSSCQSAAGLVVGYCGDNVVQAGNGEACDDGNAIDGDGCTSCVVDVLSCTPSYSHPLSTGNRTGSISIAGTILGGSSLIDGSMTPFNVGSDGANEYFELDFGGDVIISEMRWTYRNSWTNGGAGSQLGSYKVQASSNGSSFFDVGPTVDVGTSNGTTSLGTAFFPVTDSSPYRYFRLYRVTAMDNAFPNEVELEFSICN